MQQCPECGKDLPSAVVCNIHGTFCSEVCIDAATKRGGPRWLMEAAERLRQFARIAMKGTPSQAPAYWDAAHMEVYNGTPHTKLGDMLTVASAVLGDKE